MLFCLPGGKGSALSNVQIASVGTVRMRVTLGQKGRKDYALLNAKWMVYISFVINDLKIFCVINAFKNVFVYIFIYLLLSKLFWVFLCFGVSWSLEAPSIGDLWFFLCGW